MSWSTGQGCAGWPSAPAAVSLQLVVPLAEQLLQQVLPFGEGQPRVVELGINLLPRHGNLGDIQLDLANLRDELQLLLQEADIPLRHIFVVLFAEFPHDLLFAVGVKLDHRAFLERHRRLPRVGITGHGSP